jgi:hypothetical protein
VYENQLREVGGIFSEHLCEIMGWQALGTTKRILLSLQMVDGDGTGTRKLTPIGLIVVCSKPP